MFIIIYMEFWKTTKYFDWYKSHQKFYNIAYLFIEDYEKNKKLSLIAFKSFLKSVNCHSKAEEKIFENIDKLNNIFEEHKLININKIYISSSVYIFCKSLIIHMKNEEKAVMEIL
jgi:hypothetical protein